MTETIETLLAEQGLKYDETGEAIATLNRSIVFMTKGAEPGKKYRVRLLEIRPDSRGRMMYRAEPAPVEAAERWLDNGDGTVSRVEIAIDWKLVESQVKVIETRPKAAREGTPRTRTDRKPVFGSSLADSVMEEIVVTVVPFEQEVVKDGEIVWEKTGEREEPAASVLYPITQVEASGGTWFLKKLQMLYEGSWDVQLRVSYLSGENENSLVSITAWGEIPAWLQNELSARWPVCSCGLQRRDMQVSDGYGKCELCRAEETCIRCGKQTKVTNLSGRLVCDACRPYEEQEQLIDAILTPEYRRRIAKEATLLLATQSPLPEEAALIVLKANLDNVSSDRRRDEILTEWKGYRWYLFTPEGVFGTKFDPAALQLLQYLPQAMGNSLVEFVAWVTGVAKPSRPDIDFYLQTQVEGQSGVTPRLTEDLLKQIVEKLEAGKPVLADRLRELEEKAQKSAPPQKPVVPQTVVSPAGHVNSTSPVFQALLDAGLIDEEGHSLIE